MNEKKPLFMALLTMLIVCLSCLLVCSLTSCQLNAGNEITCIMEIIVYTFLLFIMLFIVIGIFIFDNLKEKGGESNEKNE